MISFIVFLLYSYLYFDISILSLFLSKTLFLFFGFFSLYSSFGLHVWCSTSTSFSLFHQYLEIFRNLFVPKAFFFANILLLSTRNFRILHPLLNCQFVEGSSLIFFDIRIVYCELAGYLYNKETST